MSRLLIVPVALVSFAGCGGRGGHGHGDTGKVLELLETADHEKGEAFVEQTCETASCHGTQDSAAPAPPLATVIPHHDDAALAGLVRNGEGNMPPLADQLDDQAIADVIAHLRVEFP